MKINIDELKCKKEEQKIQKKEPVRIYEKLVFEKKTEAQPTENSDEDRFILKESISNIKAPAAKTKSPEKHSSIEKENVIDAIDTEAKVDKPRKKVFCRECRDHPEQPRAPGLQVRDPEGAGQGRHVAGQHPLG